MSTEKLKELKLYKKLEKDLTYRQKLQEKIRQISSHPPSQSSILQKKLNNNKKYLRQEERNAQIQRQNRILFQKIQSQGIKSHYFNNFKQKYRSSKTLQSNENDENKGHHRKYNNFSQNKIHYQHEQSRISFQQNQQLMKSKPKKTSQKLITELSPEVLQLFRSRMIENKVQNQQTILFQGIAEIDSIRFKVRIFIKDKTYCLSGKNKHTEIMLKMELDQYKKFHREVLFGNPSSIFQFLVIDKGKIRFRTLEQEQQAEYLKQQKMYKIHEEQEDQNYDWKIKQKSSRKSSKHFPRGGKHQHKFLEQRMGRIQLNEDSSPTEQEAFEGINVPIRYYKNVGVKQKEKKKENMQSNINKKRKVQSHEKYKTLEEYINDKPEGSKKELRSGESTEVQVRNMKNRYKLPYI